MTNPRDTRRLTGTTPAATSAAAASTTTGLLCSGATVVAAPARADLVAYFLVVVTPAARQLADTGDAVGYGHGICEKIDGGLPYGQIISEVKADFATADEYQTSYLMAQAANGFRPAQLRNSAAGYRPPPP